MDISKSTDSVVTYFMYMYIKAVSMLFIDNYFFFILNWNIFQWLSNTLNSKRLKNQWKDDIQFTMETQRERKSQYIFQMLLNYLQSIRHDL